MPFLGDIGGVNVDDDREFPTAISSEVTAEVVECRGGMADPVEK